MTIVDLEGRHIFRVEKRSSIKSVGMVNNFLTYIELRDIVKKDLLTHSLMSSSIVTSIWIASPVFLIHRLLSLMLIQCFLVAYGWWLATCLPDIANVIVEKGSCCMSMLHKVGLGLQLGVHERLLMD